LSAPPLRLRCFGEKDSDEEFSDADVLSAVEFDTTGNYLATGDKGGRIVVFERAGVSKVLCRGCCRTL
jgi:serine/threonine-protein phosphatase 2A regulatory subunit B